MSRIAIFANFLIDSEERFLRMKDSFFSFSKADIDLWIINVRGQYRTEVSNFLKQNISDNRIKVFFFESKEGWMHDTKKLIEYINTKLIFFWVEDHICISGHKYFNQIVNDMLDNKIEYLQYSWFLNGLTLKSLNNIKSEETSNIIYLNYDKDVLKDRVRWFNDNQKKNQLEYIISMQSILSLELFKRIIKSNDFSFFNKNNPFKFEKNIKQTKWLPYKLGLTKKEFFAAIDSDQHTIGYSLISRGKYPARKMQKDMNKIRSSSSGSLYNIYGKIYYSEIFRLLKKPFRKFF